MHRMNQSIFPHQTGDIPAVRETSGPDLEELFRCYSGMAFRISMRYTHNREDADDLVSEVFIKVGRGLDGYRGEAKPMVWIYRITINQCLDYLRAKRSHHSADLKNLADIPTSVKDHGNNCLDKIALERILGVMNPVTRRILFLNQVEGLSHGEIAKVLGTSRDAVTKRLHRFSEEMIHRKEWEENHPVHIARP